MNSRLLPVRRGGGGLVLGLLWLAACTTSPAAPAAPKPAPGSPAAPAVAKPAPDKVTFVTDFAFFGYAAPLLAGVEQGFFREQNIDLTPQPGAGSADTATKVGAGAVQFGLADPFSVLIAIHQGAPLTMVAAYWQKHVGGFCYVQGRREFKSFADFEGAKMGGLAEDAYLRILQPLMRNAGRNPDAINFETMTIAASAASLLKGDIDTTSCGLSTFSSRKLNARNDAGVDLNIFIFADHGFDALGHMIVAQNDLVKNNPDLVQRFVTGFAKSVVWSRLNVDRAMDAYMKVNQQQNREGEKANLEATAPFALDAAAAGANGQFYIPPDKMQKTIVSANTWYSLAIASPDTVYTNQFAQAIPDALRQGRMP